MNPPERMQEDTAIKKITWIGMVSLLALLFLFFFVTLLNTNRLTAQIKLMTEHPFTVNADISDVRTDLALMRLRTERLQSYNQPSDVETVQEALKALYVEIETLLGEIERLYLGPADDTQALRQSFENIQEKQADFLAFAVLPSSSTKEIEAYEQEHLYPLYQSFDEVSQRILTYVRNTQQRIFTSAGQMGKSSFIWSFMILTTTTVGLFFFQYAIRKMSRRLYEKNRQFEMLSDTVDEAFLIFGNDPERCDFVSGSAERILGVPVDQLQENRLCIYKNIKKETAEEIQNQLRSETNTSIDMELEYQNPQRNQRQWLQLRAYHITEYGEQKYIITLTDRTQERQAAQALQDALINAQNANNAKKDFLSRMSHEIRTPMNAIIGMTTIAATAIDDQNRIQDCLEKIGYSSKHLLTLINDVLDMSRLESNRVKLNNEPFELYQFLNHFVSIIYAQANNKGLKFTEKTTGFSEHTTYIGDSFRLNQILLNLVSNAIKFTPQGGEVHLEVTHLPPRGQKSWIRFTVADTGIGMDQDALNRLYTPFEQANATIAKKYGGTGLGMSITQNLVTLMGGYIDVKSKPDKGTLFTVELPFEQSRVDLQPVQAGTLESLSVLVADDDRDICDHTILLLEKMKIHAEWALSGTEAVEKATAAYENSCGYDVCFLDWKMPDLDGIETTRRIREKVGWETPIIIISAYDWTEIEEEARKAGANAFIAKPLFQSSLYNVLVNVTNGAFGISRTTSAPAAALFQGKRLLLAEDNELNMEIAGTLLEMNGFQIERAENGQIAVNRFLQKEPGYFDAILMDVQMPVMDGFEAAKQIRSCGRADANEIPIIATTANAFAEDVSAVLAAGMNAHVSKPLDIQTLCSILSQFWEQNVSNSRKE